MRIVVEQYPYKESDLRNALIGFDHLPPANDKGLVRVDYVGYCFLPMVNDCVFFLPKVVLQRPIGQNIEDDLDKELVTTFDKIFGKHKPEDILCIENAVENGLIDDIEHKFLYELSVWMYRAVREFKIHNPESEIVTCQNVALVDTSQNRVENSFIDILISLQRFNEENQDFFMFVIKNIHSGFNKINWRKTIATKQPMMQDDSPIYMNPVNKKKQINFDEELLIIFFSILNYMNGHYGFPVKINFNYDLITGEKFEHYIDGYGEIRLKQIKYKYFSDKALKLWTLCYNFFERTSHISSTNNALDYLLAYKFENVFEAIIDEIIGQHNLPKKLKEQKDGKIIDHIFLYSDLVHRPFGDEYDIYYIGDSKYYKIGASVGENSIYKQYTYAKNIIQYNFDLFFEREKRKKEFEDNYIGYVDPLTEGYNITPNFFISADMGTDEIGKINFSFEDDGLKPHKDNNGEIVLHLNRHFNNRLFDRDTLWLSHYDINFLFILALYGRGNDFEKQTFRQKARKEFRRAIIEVLKEKYDFSILEPREKYGLKRAIEINFKRLHGKVYSPINEGEFVLMALEKQSAAENAQLIAEIKTYFYIHDGFELDADVDELLKEKRQARQRIVAYNIEENFVDMLMAAEPTTTYGTIERVFNDSTINKSAFIREQKLSNNELPTIKPLEEEMVLVGYFNGSEQLKHILKNLLYYIRTGARAGSIRLEQDFYKCKYLFLHHKDVYLMFKLSGKAPRLFTGKQLADKGFSAHKPDETYLAYDLASIDEVKFEDIDIQNAILRGIGNRKADSYFTTLKELFGL